VFSWIFGIRAQEVAVPEHAAPYRFSVEDYYRMGEVGILDPDDRVELIRGEVVWMTPIGPSHASSVSLLNRLLIESVGSRGYLSPQNPVVILPDSVPQPDLALAHARDHNYREVHPTPADLILLVEVADTSLKKDKLLKLPLYADSGVPEVWIVDVNRRVVEVYRDPVDDRYRDAREYGRDDAIALVELPDVTIPVADFA
jgi:Uma2 family endonuclease